MKALVPALVAAVTVALAPSPALWAAPTSPGANGHLLVTVWAAGYPEAWTIRPDGTNARRIGGLQQPVVSPDGTRVVAEETGGAQSRLWVMNIDGTAARALPLGHSAGHPVWSPSGTQVAYLRHADADRPHPSIMVVDVDGGIPRQVVAPGPVGVEFAWSPDGAHLAYSMGNHIWTVPVGGGVDGGVDGGAATRLTSGHADWGPRFSPDGSTVVYTHQPASAGEGPRLMRVPATGGTPSRLTAIGLQPAGGGHPPDAEGDPAFSPDGSRVALTFTRAGSSTIWTVPAGGGQATQLTFHDARGGRDRAPVWSPDSSLIAYTHEPGGRGPFDPPAETTRVVPARGGAPYQVGGTRVVVASWQRLEPRIFSDIVWSPHADAIEALVARGVVQGFGDGTYRPAAPVTRGQMAAFVARAWELPPAPEREPLPDTVGTTHEDAITRVLAAGIAQGFPDGTYRPAAPVTRGQMAAFVARAEQLTPGGVTTFCDTVGHTFDAEIRAVADAGIAAGFPDGCYRPNQAVTRGQMATFIVRALGN